LQSQKISTIVVKAEKKRKEKKKTYNKIKINAGKDNIS